MSISPTIFGIANKTIVFFRPKYFDIKAATNKGHEAPTVKIAPNHDVCSIVIGPEFNSALSFDNKINIAGDNHPQAHPWAIVRIFTRNFTILN